MPVYPRQSLQSAARALRERLGGLSVDCFYLAVVFCWCRLWRWRFGGAFSIDTPHTPLCG